MISQAHPLEGLSPIPAIHCKWHSTCTPDTEWCISPRDPSLADAIQIWMGNDSFPEFDRLQFIRNARPGYARRRYPYREWNNRTIPIF